MKNKKLVIGIISCSIIIIAIGLIILVKDANANTTKKIGSKNGFLIYSTDYVEYNEKKNNVVIWYGKDGTVKTEHKVKKGSKKNINKFGFHDVKVEDITDNSITISMEGLAPTKKNGTFDMLKKYTSVTINKNTGIRLNVQATDLYDGYVYFFYVKK